MPVRLCGTFQKQFLLRIVTGICLRDYSTSLSNPILLTEKGRCATESSMLSLLLIGPVSLRLDALMRIESELWDAVVAFLEGVRFKECRASCIFCSAPSVQQNGKWDTGVRTLSTVSL